MVAIKHAIWAIYLSVANTARAIKGKLTDMLASIGLVRAPREPNRVSLRTAVQLAVLRARRENFQVEKQMQAVLYPDDTQSQQGLSELVPKTGRPVEGYSHSIEAEDDSVIDSYSSASA